MLHSPILAPISKAGLGAAGRRAAGRSTKASARAPFPSSRDAHPLDCGCPLVQRGGCSCPLWLPSHFQHIPQAWRGLPGGVPDVYIIPAVPGSFQPSSAAKTPRNPPRGSGAGIQLYKDASPTPPSPRVQKSRQRQPEGPMQPEPSLSTSQLRSRRACLKPPDTRAPGEGDQGTDARPWNSALPDRRGTFGGFTYPGETPVPNSREGAICADGSLPICTKTEASAGTEIRVGQSGLSRQPGP